MRVFMSIENRKSSASCHSDASAPLTLTDTGIVALVGSPNCGKTTLFNWLTGSRFKTVNYPGSTVEHSVGETHERFGEKFAVMDTPGTYSLDPKSPDEQVTMRAIFEHRTFGSSRLVISIADATQLSRHLLLTRQLLAAGFPVILAVTMSDLLKEHQQELNVMALSRELGIPVVLIDGRLGGGIAELVAAVRLRLNDLKDLPLVNQSRPAAWTAEQVESALRKNAELALRLIQPVVQLQSKTDMSASRAQAQSTARERTRKIDAVLLHPVWGMVFFVALMTVLFSSIFWFAAPIMKSVDVVLTLLGGKVLQLDPQSLFLQFISGGVIASASAVLVFVPQIFILFLGIILLEDSGYLARSATLIDRPLSKLGMGGRSFVPLLSGYACAVPAMMAARTINSRKERWLTLFIIPLMSCSARLPVYALLLSFLFRGESSWKGGLTLTGLYFASLFIGSLAALIAGRFIKFKERSFFMLELPVYRNPKLLLVIRQALMRTKSYIVRAGPAIFTFALIIWCATTFPNYKTLDKSERLSTSYAARAGRLIEPIFEPMGGDWRTGVGLMSAFAAREVFVSSLAVVFQVTDQDESTMQETLMQKMQNAKAPNGYPLFTLSSVLGLIVFFMIALQCLSTVTMAMRETGGWRFAIFQLVVFNVVAYVLSVSLVQGLRAIGVA